MKIVNVFPMSVVEKTCDRNSQKHKNLYAKIHKIITEAKKKHVKTGLIYICMKIIWGKIVSEKVN